MSLVRAEASSFHGKWRLGKSDNFDAFLQQCQVGAIKRQAIKVVSSEHHIEQEGDKMSVKVIATGQKGKNQDYQVGESFSEKEINGDDSTVATSWNGESIVEKHKCKSFEYTLTRTLEDENTMVLELEAENGVKAKRIYKRM